MQHKITYIFYVVDFPASPPDIPRRSRIELENGAPTPIKIIWGLALLGLSSIIARRRRSCLSIFQGGQFGEPTCLVRFGLLTGRR
jgi:MYXO-CTERM domain-containing protein